MNFSIMKNMRSEDSSVVQEQNVKALPIFKTNIDFTCREIHEKIKSNTVLLKKVLGTEKYH